MKTRVLLLIALVLFAVTPSWSQTISGTLGAENKEFNAFEASHATIVGFEGNTTYFVTHKYKPILTGAMRKNCMVTAVDDQMNLLKSVEIDGTDDDDVASATMFEGKIYILLRRETRKDLSFIRYVVDAQSMTTVGEPTTIFSYTSERKDDCYRWVEQSPNKSLTGIVHIVTNKKTGTLDGTEILLDEEMNVEWRKDYPIHAMSNMVVTDDGEIIIMGTSKYETQERSKIYISILSAENTNDYSTTAELSVGNTQLVGLSGNKVLAIGAGTSIETKKEVKYFGLALNIVDGLFNISYKTLTSFEKAVFENIIPERKPKDPDIYNLMIMNCQLTKFGGVGTIQQRWGITRCNQQGICSTTYYHQGTLMIGIDNNGEILWHHPILANYIEQETSQQMFNTITVIDNDTYFIQSEEPKWGESAEITKSAKNFRLKNGSENLAVYRVDANGKISKHVVKFSVNKMLVCGLVSRDDEYIGLTCEPRKVAMLKLKFQ